MRKLLSIFALSSLLCITSAAQAEVELYDNDHLIVTIKSEPENNLIHDLIISTDENNTITMLTRTSVQSTEVFSAEQILNDKIVLATAQGRDAVLFECVNCDPEFGGDIVLSYLYNGITKKYRTANFSLSFEDGEWILSGQNGELVRTMTLKPKKLLGQVIGVDRLVLNEF